MNRPPVHTCKRVNARIRVRLGLRVLYQTIISTFRTPIDTPSDLSEFDIERLEPRLTDRLCAAASSLKPDVNWR